MGDRAKERPTIENDCQHALKAATPMRYPLHLTFTEVQP
jgi:hypothetical protein